MTSPAWLIAEREFRTYVATLSFWAALLIGPLAAGGGLIAVESMSAHKEPIAINLVSPEAGLGQRVQAAVKEAFGLDGRSVRFTDSGARLIVGMQAPGILNLDFETGFPLSVAGRALIARTLERDAA